MSTKKPLFKRSSGIIIVEVNMSNPNGDPDQGGNPRITDDGEGIISPHSVKRHIRDLLVDRTNPVWEYLRDELGLDDEHYNIWESMLKGFDVTDSSSAKKCWKNLMEQGGSSALLSRFWDMRVFGTTALEEKETEGDSEQSTKKKSGKKTAKKSEGDDKPLRFIRTGCVSIESLVSLKPVDILLQTISKAHTMQASLMEKEQGTLAPLAFSVVRHGIYMGTYTINPMHAHYTGTTQHDIDIFKTLIKHAFSSSTAALRSGVREVQIIHADHECPLTSFDEADFYDFCKPVFSGDPRTPSINRGEYTFRTMGEIKAAFPGVAVEMLVDCSSRTKVRQREAVS